jgi:hypothetical protein
MATAFTPRYGSWWGDEELAVLCGSGNLTQSGFIGNLELFDGFRIARNQGFRGLVSEVRRFVEGLIALWAQFDQAHIPAVKLLADAAGAIQQFEANQSPEPRRQIFFQSSFDGTFPSQWQSIMGKVEALEICAPYFGGSWKGIQLAQSTLHPDQINAFPAPIEKGTYDLPTGKPPVSGLEILQLKLHKEKSAFSHFKLYGFTTKAGHWIFCGSVNATEAALGAHNIEAGILRQVEKADHTFYFKSAGRLQGFQPLVQQHEKREHRWLNLWASNQGHALRLCTSEKSENLPLQSVMLEWASGPQSFERQLDSLFENKRTTSLPWASFSHAIDPGSSCATVSIRATTAMGERVEGVAFIDETAILTSEPGQRNAWRGLMAMLAQEGLPSAADLSAAFSLIDHVWEDEDPKTDSDGKARQEDHNAKPARKPVPDRVPVWPPQIMSTGHSHTAATAGGNVGWFDRILDTLLRHETKKHSTTGNKSGPVVDDEQEDAEDLDAIAAAAKAAQMRWELADERFGRMESRLATTIVDQSRASKLLRVVMASFLVLLSVRRSVRRTAPQLTLPSVWDLTNRFLRTIFGDRRQGHNYTPPFGCPYPDSIFPPIVYDAVKRFHVSFDERLLILGLAQFVAAKAQAVDTLQKPFPRRLWLTFRITFGVPDQLTPETRGSVVETAVHIMSDGKEDDVDSGQKAQTALDSILKESWRATPGYKVLDQIKQLPQSGPTHDSTDVPNFGRLAAKCLKGPNAATFVSVSPYTQRCAVPGCENHGLKQAEFQELAGMKPVICPRCLSVMVPDQLHDSYFE